MPRHKTDASQEIHSETRQRLLSAAASEFSQHGYESANINQISLKAGFAKGTVYNYFASKQALLLALIDQAAAAHLKYITTAVLQETSPQSRLEHFFQAGIEFVNQNLEQMLVVLHTMNGSDLELKSHLYGEYQPLFAFVHDELIVYGIQHNAIRQVDPQTATNLLMTLYLGSASQIDAQGRVYLDPLVVADFSWQALRRSPSSGN